MKFSEFLGRAAATGVKAVRTATPIVIGAAKVATPVVISGAKLGARVTAKTARFVGDQSMQVVEAYKAEMTKSRSDSQSKEGK